MYHEVTYAELARRRRTRIIAVIVAAVLCAAIVLGCMASADVARRQAVASTHDAVIAAARQCAAVEGSYPSSLAHLENNYGLVVNHNDYTVIYEWVADNIPPSVTVVAL